MNVHHLTTATFIKLFGKYFKWIIVQYVCFSSNKIPFTHRNRNVNLLNFKLTLIFRGWTFYFISQNWKNRPLMKACIARTFSLYFNLLVPDVMSTKRSYTLKRNWSLNVRHERVNIEEVIRNSTFSIRCRNGYHCSSTGYLAIHNLNFVTNFSFWHSFRKGTTRGFSWNIYNAKYILYLEWLVMRHGRYRISKLW